jgi:predicted xylose isomerase-like sugar epimerase
MSTKLTPEQMTQPTISQRDFFALPEVLAQQQIQMRNPPTSTEWQDAEEALVLIAARYNAVQFFL